MRPFLIYAPVAVVGLGITTYICSHRTTVSITPSGAPSLGRHLHADFPWCRSQKRYETLVSTYPTPLDDCFAVIAVSRKRGILFETMPGGDRRRMAHRMRELADELDRRDKTRGALHF